MLKLTWVKSFLISSTEGGGNVFADVCLSVSSKKDGFKGEEIMFWAWFWSPPALRPATTGIQFLNATLELRVGFHVQGIIIWVLIYCENSTLRWQLIMTCNWYDCDALAEVCTLWLHLGCACIIMSHPAREDWRTGYCYRIINTPLK